MFKKNFRTYVESGFAMDLVKVLGKYGVKFEVGDEHPINLKSNRGWHRKFTIRTTKRMYKKIMNEFHTNIRVA